VKTFVFQTSVQLVVIALIWMAVARDATKVRERKGATPAGVSPFAWGALCGLTWLALIPYLLSRRRAAPVTEPVREQNLLRWWVVLAVGAAVWSTSDAANDDANNAAQHSILFATFVVCALIAWSRDRAAPVAHPEPDELGVLGSDQSG
jgi:hypothetical protein